jgi:hypothetical protein
MPTRAIVQAMAKDVAFPHGCVTSLLGYVCDKGGLLIKNYPEFGCLRNVSFFFKFFLNPDINCFPSKHTYSQSHAVLTCQVGPYNVPVVSGFGQLQLRAAPSKPARGKPPPIYRFEARARPSEFTSPDSVETEDDVLHLWTMPTFAAVLPAAEHELRSSTLGLGAHDAELLLSYLTVPYLRIPLVITFFSTGDRIHSLQSTQLQRVLDAVLFEPGQHLPLASAGREPIEVPTLEPSLLGAAHHLLLNELRRSPATLLDGILSLVRQAITRALKQRHLHPGWCRERVSLRAVASAPWQSTLALANHPPPPSSRTSRGCARTHSRTSICS